MNGQGGDMETYMTIEEVAAYLKLANQTIRKYVLNKSIPYRKVQKSVRFRLSEIERWINEGGGDCRNFSADGQQGELFGGNGARADGEAGADGGTGAGTGAGTGTAARADGEAGATAGADGEAGAGTRTAAGADGRTGAGTGDKGQAGADGEAAE
jgi:excisionase family DNA binding protein